MYMYILYELCVSRTGGGGGGGGGGGPEGIKCKIVSSSIDILWNNITCKAFDILSKLSWDIYLNAKSTPWLLVFKICVVCNITVNITCTFILY